LIWRNGAECEATDRPGAADMASPQDDIGADRRDIDRVLRREHPESPAVDEADWRDGTAATVPT
jgi:hypothetical protein